MGVHGHDLRPAEQAERAALVEQREARRLSDEQQRRERAALDPRDARTLEQQEVARRLPQLREHVRRLEEQRQALDELRERRLDDPEHPLHELRWAFYQSDQLRDQPPHVFANSIYYAYTELHSDRDREVLFTISTDAAAKVWLNDQLIWEDIGGSPWQVGEGFRRVPLNRGYNRLLVRIANGPVYCVWSVLFCPVEIVPQWMLPNSRRTHRRPPRPRTTCCSTRARRTYRRPGR